MIPAKFTIENKLKTLFPITDFNGKAEMIPFVLIARPPIILNVPTKLKLPGMDAYSDVANPRGEVVNPEFEVRFPYQNGSR